MKKEELTKRIGLEPGEAKDWKDLTYSEKVYVARVLQEDGYANAEESVKDLNFNYEQSSFGLFWLAIDEDDTDDLQSYFE